MQGARGEIRDSKNSSGDAEQINMQEVKKVIGQLDRKRALSNVKRKLHACTDCHGTEEWRMAETVDIAVDLGEQHIRALQVFSRPLSSQGQGRRSLVPSVRKWNWMLLCSNMSWSGT